MKPLQLMTCAMLSDDLDTHPVRHLKSLDLASGLETKPLYLRSQET